MLQVIRFLKNCFNNLHIPCVFICSSCKNKKNDINKEYDNENYKEDENKIFINNMEIENNDILFKDTIPFIPPVTIGKVIKVYDGDTITIASKIPIPNSPLYRFSVRLNGIDTPEIKGKTENEKNAAKKVQKALEDLILQKNITLKNVATEKYGRILADVYLEELHINEWLINNKFAVRYDGGTKHIPEDWNNI